MIAQGILFLSKGGVLMSFMRDTHATPQLLLRCVARDSGRTAEAWTVFWSGQDAADFYHHHKHELTAGQPLQVELHNIRAHSVGYLTEITATVNTCALAPRSHRTPNPGDVYAPTNHHAIEAPRHAARS